MLIKTDIELREKAETGRNNRSHDMTADYDNDNIRLSAKMKRQLRELSDYEKNKIKELAEKLRQPRYEHHDIQRAREQRERQELTIER